MIEQNYSKAKVSIRQGTNLLYGNGYCDFGGILHDYFIILSEESSLYFVEKIQDTEKKGNFSFRSIHGNGGRMQLVEIDGDYIETICNKEEISFIWNGAEYIKSVENIILNNGKAFFEIYNYFKNKKGEIEESGQGTWRLKRKVAVLKEKYPNQTRFNVDFIYGSSITKNLKIPLIEYNSPKYKNIFWFAMQQLDNLAERLPKQSEEILATIETKLDLQSHCFHKETVKYGHFVIKPRNHCDYMLKEMHLTCRSGCGLINLIKNDEIIQVFSLTKDGYLKLFSPEISFNKNDVLKISIKNVEQIEDLTVYFEYFNCN